MKEWRVEELEKEDPLHIFNPDALVTIEFYLYVKGKIEETRAVREWRWRGLKEKGVSCKIQDGRRRGEKGGLRHRCCSPLTYAWKW